MHDQTKTRYSGSHRKPFFAQDSFHLQGVFRYINERDTSFLDCITQAHVAEDGAPPDQFGVPYYRLLHIKFHIFNKRIDVSCMVITLWFLATDLCLSWPKVLNLVTVRGLMKTPV